MNNVDRIKRSFILLAAAIVCAVGFSCSIAAGQPKAPEQITLRHFSYPGNDAWNKYFAERIEAFERLHPHIKIERIMPARVSDITDVFLTRVAGGVAPETSEVTLSVGGDFMADGHFRDLRPFYERDPEVSTDMFTLPAVRALTWSDGQIWGIPLDMFAPTTFYNADMFAEAGLPTPSELGKYGWNWDAYVESARRLTMDKNGDGRTDQWGLEDGYGVLFRYAIPVYQAGGSYFDRQAHPTRSNLLDPRTISALEWIVALYNEYRVIGSNTAFRSGDAALTVQSAPAFNGLRASGINVGVATNTMGPEHNGGYYAVNSVNITRYAQHPDEAWEFIKFLAVNTDNQRDFVKNANRLTSHLEVLKDYEALTGLGPDVVQPVIDTIMNPDSFHDAIGPGARDAITLIADTLYARAYGQREPVRLVLESLHPQVQSLLNQ